MTPLEVREEKLFPHPSPSLPASWEKEREHTTRCCTARLEAFIAQTHFCTVQNLYHSQLRRACVSASHLFPCKIKLLNWNLCTEFPTDQEFFTKSMALVSCVNSTSCNKSSFFNYLCWFTDEPQTFFLIFWSTSLFVVADKMAGWLPLYYNPCIQSKQKIDIALRTGTIGSLVDILMLFLHPVISRMKSSWLCFVLLQHFSTEELKVLNKYKPNNSPGEKKNGFVVLLLYWK